MSARVYGYQLGYVESTRYGVVHFIPPEPVADVEGAIERLIADVLLPILTEREPEDVAYALYHLARGGFDPDRSWDDTAPFQPSGLIERADEMGWQFGGLFADEVMQSADVWIRRGWGHVYTREDPNGRKPRRFVMPSPGSDEASHE